MIVDEKENREKPGIVTRSLLSQTLINSRKILENIKVEQRKMKLRTVVIDRKTTIQTTSKLSDEEIRQNFINRTNYYPV